MKHEKATGCERPVIITLIDCGSVLTAAIRDALEARGIAVQEHRLERETGDEVHLAVQSRITKGIVISGSGDHLWQDGARCLPATFLSRAIDRRIPVLGICYGHQMLAKLAGARVVLNPRGEESGEIEVEVLDENGSFPLFHGLDGKFKVFMKHRDIVEDTPTGWTNHARTTRTGIVAIKHPACPVFGLQFHPETSGARVRNAIFDNFVSLAR